MTFTLSPDANGILPDRMIAAMADAGLILPAYPFVESQIQPASLDLRLGDIAYRVRASFLPGPGATVAERIDELKLHEIDLTDGAVLETNCVYIVPLLESLALPPEIVAAANPKSSTGRLDVFTRVIADGTRRFDMIGAGYHGPLYAEISPKTFPVLLREGSRLSARCASAPATPSSPPTNSTRCMIWSGWSMSTTPTSSTAWRSASTSRVKTRMASSAIAPSVTPAWSTSIAAAATPSANSGNRSRRGPTAASFSIPASSIFWPRKKPSRCRRITPRKWCRSIRWSANSACIMPASSIPVSATPAPAGRARARCWKCARAKCPFILEHGQIVGRLVYEKMLARPDALYGQRIGSNYQAQGLKLSKHFRV